MSDAFITSVLRCDVFCRVIDNFGDAGVCWRLVAALHRHYGWSMRLFIDDLHTLARLVPAIDPTAEHQTADSIQVVRWSDPIALAEPADVVIEAFACEIPAPYLEAMATRIPKPCWINLEYLSAEPWIDECHGVASPHPRLPLNKTFFFPGFSERSGGVLIESDLLAKQTAFRAQPARRQEMLAALGLDPATPSAALLLCYPTPCAEALLDAWAQESASITCILPRKSAPLDLAGSAARWRVHPIDFVAQNQFDELLWSCDFAVVRGEDSFVRAQLAGLVFIWHIYPQNDTAHLIKLDAFMDRYTAGLETTAARAWRALNFAWNTDRTEDIRAAWRGVRAHWPSLQKHALVWRDRLVRHGDLTCHLRRVVAEQLK